MNPSREPLTPITILLADDSENNRLMAREALIESRVVNELREVEDGEVEDGEELMNCPHRRGAFGDADNTPRPALILLDLKVPRKRGLEALREIKADAFLSGIAVVILTTWHAEVDTVRSYDAGVNSFIFKPVTFAGLAQVRRTFGNHWIGICAISGVEGEA